MRPAPSQSCAYSYQPLPSSSSKQKKRDGALACVALSGVVVGNLRPLEEATSRRCAASGTFCALMTAGRHRPSLFLARPRCTTTRTSTPSTHVAAPSSPRLHPCHSSDWLPCHTLPIPPMQPSRNCHSPHYCLPHDVGLQVCRCLVT